MARGKGVKIINVPLAKVARREDYVVALVVFPEDAGLTVYSGKRHMRLSVEDLNDYIGERALRGPKLPRGFRQVNAMEQSET